MNTLQIGVTTLIRSALTQRAYPLPEDFKIEDAASVIRRHHIASLCYEGAVLCGIPTDSAFMGNLFKRYCATTVKTMRQERAVAKLFQAFETSGIDYIPLKGSRMRPLYPKPELRIMGDADILIRQEQYERIVPRYTANRSEEYWTGWALAYYQWETRLRFEEICRYVPIHYVKALYYPYHEMDIRQFVDKMNEMYKEAKPYTNLKLRRRYAGLSQKEISLATGIPIRTIQQYEQRQKDINKAQVGYLLQLSKTLCCDIECLLEKV